MANENGKRAAGEYAARLVTPGMTVGLGTGSTAECFHEALAARVRDGLEIRAVATSEATARRARSLGIPVVDFGPETAPDLTVDGADEIGPNLSLIKGGGGALVREKLVAAASKRMVVIADASKRVAALGAFPLPVAVVPFAVPRLVAQLRADFEVPVSLRVTAAGEPLVTDDHLHLLDLHFDVIPRPALLEKRLKHYVGVVDSGLFVGIAAQALLGHDDGAVTELWPE
jgi:ribose 5-phosphate isomerase A